MGFPSTYGPFGDLTGGEVVSESGAFSSLGGNECDIDFPAKWKRFSTHLERATL